MKRVLLLAMLLTAERVYACSCAPPPAPDGAFARASVVFEGKVIAKDDQYTAFRQALDAIEDRLGRSPSWSHYERSHGFKVTFEVTTAWKGGPKKRFVLYTGRGGGDCGFPFEKGKTYVVYAYCDTEYCATMICTRTALSTRAAEDLRYLATLRK